MSWRDQLQPASFRGVEFYVDNSSGTFGRRNAVHEYPQQDVPWVEDLGSKAREHTIEAYVIGDDYMARRDALIDAIDQGEPGALVHPRLGARTVSATDQCRWRESTREGGMATFTLVLIESGERQFPANQADSVAVVDNAVNSGLTALQSDFASVFSIAGLPGWVSMQASALFDQGFALLSPFIAGTGIASALVRTFDGISTNLTTLLGTPGSLASQFMVALGSLFGEFDDIDTPRTVRRQLADSLNATTSPTITTPARQQQANNRRAVIDLFITATTLLTARSIARQSKAVAVTGSRRRAVLAADSPFDSYDHAIAVRDELVVLLDTLAETASDEMFVVIQDLKPALVRHINAHGFSLVRVARYTPPTDTPALVIAHGLYGDARLEADLVRRNNVRHPGFVAGGVPIEVISTETLNPQPGVVNG